MKKVAALALATAAAISLPAFAEPTVYGKINVSLEQADEGTGSVTELVSNASRIGLKGTETLSDTGLDVFYKVEYETFIDDGEKDENETLSQRNIYVGVKGAFGSVQAGMFDTPLKTMQNKIDLFNDLRGDIKNIITNSDNRTKNTVSYTTPSTLGGFNANVALIASESEDVSDATSFTLGYEANGFYGALGVDSGVESEETDVIRAVFQYNVNDFQIGALYEEEDTTGLDTTDAVFISAQYKLDKVVLKAQYGQSDIQEEGGTTTSIGADYKISKNFTTFAFYTVEDSDLGTDNQYLALGAILKF